jgi:hypothetical protein
MAAPLSDEHTFRHLLHPLFELQNVATRLEENIYARSQIQEDIPPFLTECRLAAGCALNAEHWALQQLAHHQTNLLQMIRLTLIQEMDRHQHGRFPP